MASTEIPNTNAWDTQSLQSSRHRTSDVNIRDAERWASATIGGALMAYGLRRPSWSGVLLTLVGGSLLHRAITGYCLCYEAFGVNTAYKPKSGVASVAHGQGIKVEKSVMISQSPEELYRFWRNFENLPCFMTHLESVKRISDKRSHWVAKAPAGTTVEWDAEVYNEKENELIAWRSLQNADVNHAGSVHFESTPYGWGTNLRVVLSYEPPAGKIGAAIAKLFGEEPERQVEEDLQRFKQIMEKGEIPIAAGHA